MTTTTLTTHAPSSPGRRPGSTFSRPGAINTTLTHLTPLILAIIFLFIVDPLFLRSDSDDPLTLPILGNIVRRVVLAGLYLWALAGVISQAGTLEKIWEDQKPILFLLGYAFLSAFWSTAPVVTITRSLHFAGLLLISWCALRSLSNRYDVLQVFRWVLAAAMFLSLLWVIAVPEVGLSVRGDAWRGIFHHKSDLGGIAVIALAVWLPKLSERDSSLKLSALGAIALAIVLVWQSNSVTELLGAVTLLSFWFLSRIPLPWGIKAPAAGTLLLLGMFWFLNLQQSSIDILLQQNFGRDITLTGRTPLWDAIRENINLHPFLGEGYNGFWVAGNDRAEHLIQTIGWDAYHAHNGYLEVLNALGIFGSIIFAVALGHAFLRAWKCFQQQESVGLPFLMILIWLCISSLTKSVFCQGTTIGWVTFLVTYAVVTRTSREPVVIRREQRHPSTPS